MIRQPSFALLLASFLALSAAACSADHSEGSDAGILVPDSARPPDAVFYDAGSVPGSIGVPCAADTDCHGAGARCLAEPQIFPGGYCSAMCDPAVATSCPTGAQCQDFGRGMTFCVLTCDPGVMTRQCGGRANYGCSMDPQLSGVCVGGCVDATDCPTGLMCDQTGGQLGSGACFTPGAMIGAACVDDTQCPAGGGCQDEANGGWPGGSCIAPGCDLPGNTGCSGDAQCIGLGGFGGPPQGY